MLGHLWVKGVTQAVGRGRALHGAHLRHVDRLGHHHRAWGYTFHGKKYEFDNLRNMNENPVEILIKISPEVGGDDEAADSGRAAVGE